MAKVEMRATQNPSLIVAVILEDGSEAVVKFSGSSALVDSNVADAMVKDVRHNRMYRKISLAEETLERLQAEKERAAAALKDAQEKLAATQKQTEAHQTSMQTGAPSKKSKE